jgi:flagellar biosynthesis/type III secretory pathway M-ring protein FliF/YscJ
MTLLKYIFYFILAFIIVRYLMRIMYPPQKNQNPNSPGRNSPNSDSLEKPKIKIEAESVDYEIIEEPKKKNEE